MTAAHRSQRGEGKVGCAMSLVLLVAIGTLAVKIVPVYYSNDRFIDAVEELAGQAGTMTQEALELNLRNRAKGLEIREALAKGAITVSVSGTSSSGSCTIEVNYTRRVDFFGAYALPVETHRKIMKAFVDSR